MSKPLRNDNLDKLISYGKILTRIVPKNCMQVESSAKVHLLQVRRKGRIKCSPVPLIHVASMTKSTSPFSFGGFILKRKSSCSLRALLAVWVWSKLAEFWHSATKATKALSLLLDSDVWLVLKASWCKTGTIFTNCRELQTFSTTKNVCLLQYVFYLPVLAVLQTPFAFARRTFIDSISSAIAGK